MPTTPQSNVDLPGIKKLRSGKVREVFDLGDTLLFVVTDRLSAFDVILPDPIPAKGAVLNQLSAFWFKRFSQVDNHFITADFDKFPGKLQPFRDQLAGRSMIVKKTKPLTVECVVRGYLAGSGWKEYQKSQSVCGIKLPPGLQLASQLPEPIFTPSTKAEEGHDENIDMKECARILGDEMAKRVKDLSLKIYEAGRAHAANCGIIVADTKFEFGLLGDQLLLIDECLTPDSSGSGRLINMSSARVRRVSTNNSCAIISRRSIGTRRLPALRCRPRSSRKPPRNIAKPSNG